jgi:formylglycine-generating enzyme required for sulfatase activity/serine/threonine protein kinase
MPIPLDQFTRQLADSGLMSADDIGALVAALSDDGRPADGESLARELVRQKKLTAWQAQQIYQGRGKGLVLGNYVVLDKLGQGGMGMVLKAEHRRMERLVALKVLSPAVTKSPEAVARFQREVKAAAKLNHPNIVTAYDADEAGGTHFLVMEYVEGTDLSALVKKNGPLPLDRALHCVTQAARGLEYAHSRGVVHRDIKPANLLLDRDGTVKILDMGLARLDSAGEQQDELTGTGQIMGTVDYMAPEQALSTKSADRRADIYSLGITLWYLLCGRPAYGGDSAMAKLLAHRERPIPSLRDACPAAPPALDAVFARMVAKTPEARYQTMTQVIADLERGGTGREEPPSQTAAPGEDSRLSEFLRGLEQSEEGRGRVRAVLAQVTSPIVTQETLSSSRQPGDTDPTTEQSLGQHPTRLAGRGKNWPRWMRRLPIPTTRRNKMLAGGAVALLVLAGIAGLWRANPGSVRVAEGDSLLSVGTTPATDDPASIGQASEGRQAAGDNSQASGGRQPPGDMANQSDPPSSVDAVNRAHQDLIASAARYDHALEFDGVDDFVELPTLTFDNTRPFTLELWADVRNPDQDPLLAQLSGVPSRRGKLQVITAKGLNSLRGEVYADLDGTVGDKVPYQQMISAHSFRAGLLHAALCWDPAGTVTLYENGQLVSTTNSQWELARPTGQPSTIGSVSSQAGKSWLQGRVWRARLSNVIRYTEDFTPTADWEPDTETVALYRFDDGAGDVLTDASGNGHHGKIIGASWVTGDFPPASAIAPFDAAQAKKHQQEWADYVKTPVEVTNSIGMKFQLIPPGRFQMGSTDAEIREYSDEITRLKVLDKYSYVVRVKYEAPRHPVELTRPLYMGVHEVTQGQFARVMHSTPSHFSREGPGKDFVQGTDVSNLPVEMVGWLDAVAFCNKLSLSEGLTPCYEIDGANVNWVLGDGYRLPTEAEWEFATRAGSTGRFYFGSSLPELDAHAWHVGNAANVTHPVGTKLANPFGLHDVYGNVWEWCYDIHDKQFYEESPIVNPLPPKSGKTRMARGGSYSFAASESRSASRGTWTIDKPIDFLGFRVCRGIAAPELDPAPVKGASATDSPRTAIDPFAVNRQAAEWVLARGGKLTLQNARDGQWLGFGPDKTELPTAPFVLRMIDVRDGKVTSNLDLDHFIGCRHLQSLTLTGAAIDNDAVEKLAALPMLGLLVLSHSGDGGVTTSGLSPLRASAALNSLAITSEMVDDDLAAVAQLPSLRSLNIYGRHVPDLRRLAEAPELRVVYLPIAEAVDPQMVETLQAANPRLRIVMGGGAASKALGRDPVAEAARHLLALGIELPASVDGTTPRKPLTAVDLDATHAWIAYVEQVPSSIQLTATDREMLMRMEMYHFTAEGQNDADALAESLANNQSLASVNVARSDLTDNGLSHLRRLVGLRALNVAGTKVSQAGVDAFHQAVPACHITSDFGAIPADLTAHRTAPEWTGWPLGTPAPAIAPFDAARAKKHQEDWAAHLGVPVEYTNSIGMKFRLIPPGEFQMGSTKEEIDAAFAAAGPEGAHWQQLHSEAPLHRTILTRPFYLGVYEVTQGQYEQVMGRNPSQFSATGVSKDSVAGLDTSAYPVEQVSWNDAAEFCVKLSQAGPLAYQLPTEAEWEFACRAGTTTKFWSSDQYEDLPRAGWYVSNSGGRAHAMGECQMNPWGLYDLHGNVWEWVRDWWDPNYYARFQANPAIDPAGPTSAGSQRAYHGGGWNSHPVACRAATRDRQAPDFRSPDIGFRVTLSVDAVRHATSSWIGTRNDQNWLNLLPPRDLDGWRPFGDKPGCWERIDGQLMASGGEAFLRHERDDFRDFHLRAEVAVLDGGDANLVVRAGAAGNLQCKLRGDANIGSLYAADADKQWRLVAQAAPAAVAPGEFFALELTAQGNQFSASVNGQEVARWTDEAGYLTGGGIELWNHLPNTRVVFRKLEIRKQPSAFDLFTSPDWEWTPPENLGPVLNSPKADMHPRLSADGLTLLFVSGRDGGLGLNDIYQSVRDDVDSPWQPPTNLGPVINSPVEDTTPCLSADGLTLVWSSKRSESVGDFDIFLSRRSGIDAPWQPPESIGPAINTAEQESGTALSADGLTLLFHGIREGDANFELWMAQRPDLNAPFGTARRLGSPINSDEQDLSGFLSADGTVLLFDRHILVDDKPTNRDLWWAARRTSEAAFDPPRRIDAVNDAVEQDAGASLSSDGRTLYFWSRRAGGYGGPDLWFSRRVPKTPR